MRRGRGRPGAEDAIGGLVTAGYRVHTLVEQDAVGRLALRPVLTDRDRTDLLESVRLVVARGHHRGRDLEALAGRYLAGR